jgi:hypothetical protein
MKFNPYPVLLTTGALMFATVVFAQVGPVVSLVKGSAPKAGVASQANVLVADDASDPDVARHPDTRVASVDVAATENGGSRTLKE